MPINTSFAGPIPWLNTEPPTAALARGAAVGAQIGAARRQAAALRQDAEQFAQSQALRERHLKIQEEEERRRVEMASRAFAAQEAYRTAVERDLSDLEQQGKLTDEEAVKVAAKHYLRYGAAMGPGFGGALGGMISTEQRAKTAEMTAEHRRGLLESREKELQLSRDRLEEMGKQKDLDRQQKQALQDQKDAITRELETMKEQGRKDRALLSAQTAISRASQIPDHMRRDAYKAEIQQLLNNFPNDVEFDKGLKEIMDKYKVKSEPSANPAEVVPGKPAQPTGPTRRLRFDPKTGRLEEIK